MPFVDTILPGKLTEKKSGVIALSAELSFEPDDSAAPDWLKASPFRMLTSDRDIAAACSSVKEGKTSLTVRIFDAKAIPLMRRIVGSGLKRMLMSSVSGGPAIA